MLNLNTLRKALFPALVLIISTLQFTNATAADALFLDNGEPGTSFKGTWKVSGGVNPYGNNSLYASASGASYTFNLDLPTAGQYQVYAWWTEWSNAGTREFTIDFDAPTPPGSSNSLLSGVFEGIDFGQGQWRWESAWKANPSNHIFFDSASGRARDFQFASSPAVLTGMRVTAGTSGVLTLSDDAGQTFTTSLSAGRLVTIDTGWTQAAKTVTVNYSAGWELAVDDITYLSASTGGDGTSRRSSVPIDITHLGGTSTVTVNQRQNGGQWNQLGSSWNFGTKASITVRSLGSGSTSVDAIMLVPTGNNGLASFPVDLRGSTPEQASITLNTNKPASATSAVITLTTYDADFPNEGELVINGNTPVALFGTSGVSGNDQNSADISFSTPASYWRNGNNTLLFRHTRTQGYIIDDVTVSFESSSTGSNVAPVLASIGNKSVTAGTTLFFNVSATDDDGNPPILEAKNLPADSAGFMDNKDGTGLFAIWPDQSSAPGTQNVTFIARDSQDPNLTDSETIAISIAAAANNNTAPTINGSPATTVTAGNNYVFQPSASDADGDSLTFSIAGRPSWASFNNNTGRLSGTPGSAGTFSNIRISVSDGQSTVALPTFSITVNQAAPQAGSGFPVDLRGSTPEQASVIINTNKPADATSGIITLTTYDADFPNEGELVINGNTPVALFGASGVSGNDQNSADISLSTPASYWRNGDNTLLFRHTRTQGYIIDAVKVSFEAATNTAPPTNTGSVSLSWTAPVARADGSALALSEISGYTVYYGPSPGNHPNSLNINDGSATSATITDLPLGTYYMAVTTRDSGGRESGYSSEVRIVIN